MPLDVAARRAATIFDLRYDLSLTIPQGSWRTRSPVLRASPSSSPTTPRHSSSTSRRVERHVKAVRAGGATVNFEYVNGHIVLPREVLKAGSNIVSVDFVAGNDPLNRSSDFLYALFVPARARQAIPGVRPAGPEGSMVAQPRVPGRLAGRQQRRSRARSAAGSLAPIHGERCSVRGDAAALDVPLLLRRRRLHGRDGRAQRPDVPDVPSRDRRREGGAQQGGDLRSACDRTRVTWRSTPAFPTVRQVRLRADPGVPVRRHGACRQDSLQRQRPAARRVGDAEPAARPRVGHRPRNRAHVVRRPGDDALVQRRVDEGSVRELHGGEDRQSVVPGREPRAALPARALPGRLRGGSDAGREPDPAAAGQPERGRQSLRRDHLSEGARS